MVVFAPNWLGDAVMALPAIADVQRAASDTVVEVAARPAIAPLFELVPGIGQVVTIAGRAAAVEALRQGRYDAALLLPNSFNAALLARRAGIPERWGYRADLRGPLLTRAATRPVRVHQAEYYQHLARALGFASGPLEPRLELTALARQAALDVLAAEGWDNGSPLVALAPGAAYGGAKRWPAASFAALAAQFADDGLRSVLVGSGGDALAGGELVEALPSHVRVINLIGRTDLPTFAGVLAACRHLVTNDSGAMHVAAALGVGVTAMFGPTNEHETRPLGRGVCQVLTHPVWCRPCMLRECPLTHRCMRGITVEMVRDAAHLSIGSTGVMHQGGGA
jgi:heptosyltransferase-2